MEARSLSAAQLPAPPAVRRRNFRSSHLPNNRIIKSVSTTQLKSDNNGTQFDGPSKKLFILGMGYVGQFFAQELKYQGWNVSGTCTNPTKKKDLEQKGYEVHVFDALQPEWKMLDKLRCCTHLLVSIPPDESVGDPMLQHEEYVRTRVVDGNLQWLCYLSSTSVYGDAKGALVNEDYSPKPCSNLAKMRLNAEDRWLNLGQDLGLSTFVLRLGGIYGPGRSAIHTILKKERLSERQKRRVRRNFTSRVHVADICQTLRASISMQGQRKIYNVVDDDPASRAEVFAFAQHLIDTRWPGLINPTDISIDSSLHRGGEKRVSNARIKKELGVRLFHPSYRSGLQSIIDNMEDPILHLDSKNNC